MKTWIVFVIAVFTCTSLAFATDLDGYTFLKISGSDARAVVKTPEGEKQLVAPGTVLGKATIKEITDDRVVLEQLTATGTTLIIVKVQDGQQQVSRLQK